MATWNRQPTGDSAAVGESGQSDVISWVAAGHLTTKEALEDGSFPITFNDPHPDYGAVDSAMRCDGFRIVAAGFRVMRLEASFSVPPDGDAHLEKRPDESLPLVYSWATIRETVAVDRDRDGNAIIYSSGRAASGVTQSRNYKQLTVTRWENSYNLTQAMEFENTVSSGTFEGAAAGEVSCMIIQPSQSYTDQSLLIPIDYQFAFKATSIWGAKPFQTIFHDRDSVGKIDTGELRQIVTAGGEAVGAVPLNGGAPADSTLTYFDKATDNVPQSSPSWTNPTNPSGATVVDAGTLKMLRWNTLPEKDYGTLGL